MKTSKYILSAFLLGASMSSCDDLFEPALEMKTDLEVMYNDPVFAAGILGNAYILMPFGNGAPQSDLATDDAVSNLNENEYRSMAAGAWSSQSDPLSQWQSRNLAIQYINLLLDNVDKVTWSGDESINPLLVDRYRGDCLGMRALHRYYLLRAHSGKVNGELKGVPFFDGALSGASDFNMERPSFKDCIDAILADIDEALLLLPETYKKIDSESDIPSKYKSLGTSLGGYNRAFGEYQHGKINGQILKALRSKVSLLAASPAYQEASGISWQKAAEDALAIIADKKLVANGNHWYNDKDEIAGIGKSDNSAEAIWMTNPGDQNSLESDNFPPSIYGLGRVNPTQNLVDAFPMANGYPINDSRSGYNPNKPYEGRDPRLDLYIVVNGSSIGNDATYEVNSAVDGSNDDAMGREPEKSTRTGYYLRKLLRNEVNLNPNSKTSARHYQAYIRWTEMFLNYAEAANEAVGPTSPINSNTSKSAKSVIKDIRERAGICVGTADPYLDECAGSKEKMRELIHNERRLELCFENHRFYDLRRWNENLNPVLKGMKIEGGVYSVVDLTDYKLNYKDYMNFGPIPYSEILKFSNLQQNTGW